jgi:hypothetical protein
MKTSYEFNPRPQWLPGIFLLSMIMLLVSACTAQQSVASYSEDISVQRPTFPVVVDTAREQIVVAAVKPEMHATKNVNGKVDDVLDSIDRFNLTHRFVEGYTAQIYSGPKKEDALNSKLKATQEIPDLGANLQYAQPKFRVTVGHYFSKIEAQRDLIRLKRVFPNAILVPEKIQIR